MKSMAIFLALALCVGTSSQFALGQSATPPASQSTAPDNSRSNKTDPTNRTATADSQPETTSDRQVVAEIRKSIVADKSLSTYAHNIKIVSSNGQVTLNGVVRTEEEKNNVAAKAASVAGNSKVVNQLKVDAK